MQPPQPIGQARSPSTSHLWPELCLTIVILCGLGTVAQSFVWPTPQQALRAELAKVILAHQAGGLSAAEQLLVLSPQDPYDLALAGEIAALNSEHTLAIERFERLPQDLAQWELHRSIGVARRMLIQGKLSEAIVLLERAVQIDPASLAAHAELSHLLQLAGRCWEAAPHMLKVVQLGKCRGDELFVVSGVESFFRSDERLELLSARSDHPEPVMQLADARRAAFDNDFERAERLLRTILTAQPEVAEAQGRLARILSERGDAAAFTAWWQQLPEEAKSHPEVWYAQGIEARRVGQLPAAVRCYWECLRLSPSHLAANLQIAGCLTIVGQPELARAYQMRASLISDLESALSMLRNSSDPTLIRQTISLLSQLGRWWEAAGWCYALYATFPDETDARLLKQLARRASLQHAAQDPLYDPTHNWDATAFPLPNWSKGSPPDQPTDPLTADLPPPDWEFHEAAGELGIQFDYVEGTTEENRLEHIFAVIGGGVGTFDYDHDGWPDLYLAQAHPYRENGPSSNPGQPHLVDRFYRNQFGQHFAEVTASAGLGDADFSHGVTVGDYNQDGHPDVYVNNLGKNRLYQNNGDGTFADVTALAGVAGADWSTSSVLADFSGDGSPDLYVANYAPVDEARAKLCQLPDGQQISCNPKELSAASDRYYQNNGDGTFTDQTMAAGVEETTGRGLGLIAADFTGTGQLGLFVGNDTSPNFLLLPQAGKETQGVRFTDEAVVRGVGLDRSGNVLASMGIAAGDVTGDGHLDLCVTNYFADGSVFFSQQPDLFFEDRSRQWGVDGPSFWMLGFGNQFADFDGDSWPDMLVTNGHVNQVTEKGTPDRMPLQLFWNRRGQRFTEVAAAQLGPVFERRRLGRGLAVWDFNRDGHLDAVVSHLHDPLSVLNNRTPQGGVPLVVRLVGRTGTRDAVGAAVQFTTPSRRQTRLILSGDGYLVSNERLVHFSAAPGEPVEITVQWPGGRIDRHASVEAGQEIVLVEGGPQAKRLRRWTRAADNSGAGSVK